jgi:hypothetical protein
MMRCYAGLYYFSFQVALNSEINEICLFKRSINQNDGLFSLHIFLIILNDNV